jgi:sulfur transfer complex TusBCD TusB component (DsrH family)
MKNLTLSLILACLSLSFFQASPSTSQAMPTATTGDPWKMLVIVYPNIDVDYVDINGVQKHLKASMPQADQNAMIQDFRNQPHRGIVYSYSDHTAELEANIVISSRTLTHVSEVNGVAYSYWPSPDDTLPEIQQYAPAGTYDSILIMWQASDPNTGQSIPSGGWGWGGWMGPYNMTYATVFNLSRVWPTDPCKGEVFLHEWLHGVTGFYASHGFPFSVEDLHGAEEAGYTQNVDGCWLPWLQDYMRGLVIENGKRTALVPETWQMGSITTHNIQGWRGEYFNNATLSDLPVVVRDDNEIKFEWQGNSPHPLLIADRFSARFKRTWYFNAATYRFHLAGDGGVRLWVDGNLVIDQWKDQLYTEYTKDIALSAGNHTLKVEYYEDGGWASVKLWWETLGASCPTISEWMGEYYNNRTLSGNSILCRNDSAINFTWNDGGPGGGVGNDNFSARWTRTLSFNAGRYRFHGVADDGIRMWLDGNLIIDQWKDQGATEYTADRDLTGGNHTLKVEYYENGGGAVAKAWWEMIGVACPTISEWKGEYYNNRGLSGGPALCRNDSAINFTWNDGGPGGGIGNDNFSVRWTRTLSFNAGYYRFHALADDGIRMWLDGNLIIDQWKDQGATEYIADRDLAAGSHTVKVEYYENGGGAIAKAWWEALGVCPTISEWRGEYYNNRGLSGNPILCRNDSAINFTWNDGGPGGGVGNDNFSARWTRTLSFNAGRYRFHVVADDGIRMWLDGNLIIDQWKDQGATEYIADRDLAAGNHTLKVEYYEYGGGAVARAWWEMIGVACPTISEWKGEYYNNRGLSGGPALCRNDSAINFTWNDGGPGGGIGNDNFSARWTRTLSFSAGYYRFHALADDGIRMWLDGNLIIDQWKDQGATEYIVYRDLAAGNHTVKVEYYENGGGAVAKVWWEVAGACPTISEWKGEYYNNRGLSGNPALCRNDSAINFTWNDGGPGGGVGNDNFSARWTRTLSFNAGRYRFHVAADDGIRMWLDGSLIIDQWKDQGTTEYIADRDLTAGNHTLKVEYYEYGGGAIARAWWELIGPTCTDQYKAEYFNNRALSGSASLTRCEGWPINYDWGSGGPGGGIGIDNFSARWTGRANFSAGTYTFIARADDGIRVYLDNQIVIDAWRDQGPTEYRQTRTVSAGAHDVRVEYYEYGGGAVAQFRWEQAASGNLALRKTASATSQELSYTPPANGNDGSNTTRWSSRNAADVGQEWWWVDLGSLQTFNQIVINWEAAYAANYFICWSETTSTCSGYNYAITSAGQKTHNVGTRTARYVWVRMDTRAPGMGNYSFYELEVYRTAGLMDSDPLDVVDESAEVEVDISAVLPDVPDGQIEIEQP